MEKHDEHHDIEYFVDNEVQRTDNPDLTVAQILQKAGLDPATHYLIELRGHDQVPLRDINQVIHIQEKEKFISVFSGPTPVS